jgi:hypothetical protein
MVSRIGRPLAPAQMDRLFDMGHLVLRTMSAPYKRRECR